MSKRRWPFVVAAIAATAVLTNCAESNEEGAPGPGLLLVSDAGQFEIVEPAGAIRLDLADIAGDDAILAVWSSDAERVAWAQTDSDPAASTDSWVVVSISITGDDRRVASLAGRPDYLTFESSSDRILALVSSPSGFGLFVADPSTDGTVPTVQLAAGAPLFTDQAPNAGSIVAHIGEATVLLDPEAGLDAANPVLDAGPRVYSTPVWDPVDDDVVYFGRRLPGVSTSELIRHEVSTGEQAVLATYGQSIWFDVSPDGTMLAASVPPVDADALTGEPEVIQVSSGRQSRTGPLLDQGVWIVALATGEVTQLTDQLSIGPVWSPDSQWVLARHSDDAGAQFVAYGIDGTSVSGPRHRVTSPLSGYYLQFWDQFMQAGTVWSPDSAAFVFAGSVDDTSGIWRQSLDGDSAELVTDGEMAFWSPR